jgi:integration host factor subunit beta
MVTVTKKVLIDRVADRAKLKRALVRTVLEELLEQVTHELASGNRLELRHFGVFVVKHRAPRVAQNPKTLQRVQVPPKRTVKFKSGRDMRNRLDHGFGDSGSGPTVEVKPRKRASPPQPRSPRG